MNKTDIIVLSHGRTDLTKRCFETVARCTQNYRVIWVDNGSGEKSVNEALRSAKRLESLELIRSEDNLGFSRGVNLALRRSLYDQESTYIALLNNDVIVTQDWLGRLRKHVDNTELDVVAPLSSDNTDHSVELIRQQVKSVEFPSFTDESPDERSRLLLETCGNRVFQVRSMLSFFCVVMTRKTVEDVGLLDENIFAYGEDNEYCERLKRLGKKLGIAVDVYVHHDHGATSSLLGDDWTEVKKREGADYVKKKYSI